LRMATTSTSTWRSCAPRWLKLDREELGQTGGVAITLGNASVRTVNGDDQHPWVVRNTSFPRRESLVR